MKQRKFMMFLAVTALGAGLFLYNYWSYRCGRCTTASLFILSPPAVALLICNLVAFLLLCGLKLRNQRRGRRQSCSCGNLLHRNWQFCPGCGSACR